MHGKEIEVNGVNLKYYDLGSGPVIVMLHGNNENSQYFEFQVNNFIQSHRVILVDSRGHGDSQMGQGDLSYQVIADDIVQLLDKIGIKQASFIGFSDGGIVALLMYKCRPELFNLLVLVGVNFKVSGLVWNVRLLTKLQVLLLKIGSQIWDKYRNKYLITRMMIQPIDISEDDLRAIHHPTLILVGQFDVIDCHHTYRLHQLISSSQLEIIQGASHDLLRTHPQITNDKILNFFKIV